MYHGSSNIPVDGLKLLLTDGGWQWGGNNCKILYSFPQVMIRCIFSKSINIAIYRWLIFWTETTGLWRHNGRHWTHKLVRVEVNKKTAMLREDAIVIHKKASTNRIQNVWWTKHKIQGPIRSVIVDCRRYFRTESMKINKRSLWYQMLNAIGGVLTEDFICVKWKQNLEAIVLQLIDEDAQINNELSTYIWFLHSLQEQQWILLI